MPSFRISLLALGLLAGAPAVFSADPAQVATPTPTPAPAKPAPPPTSRALRGLVYASPGGVELKLDLHLPLTPPEKPVPLLVWIHGGGWQEGNRGFCPLSPLVKEGYAVASLSYRFTQVAPFPAQIEDCRAAIRWLRAHAAEHGYDPARIGVAGESAGGLLAALLGTESDAGDGVSTRVQAVVALCPGTDLTQEDVDLVKMPALLASADPKEVRLGKIIQSRAATMRAAYGGPPEEHREMARRMSPVTHVTADDPPFYLIHGDRDDLVPIAQSELMEAALKKAGVPVTFEVVKGAGHGFGRPKPDMMARIKAFFDANL
jgi:acetyl esterase/lipase